MQPRSGAGASPAPGGHRQTMSLDRRIRTLAPTSYPHAVRAAGTLPLVLPPPDLRPAHLNVPTLPVEPSSAGDSNQPSAVLDGPLSDLHESSLPPGLDRLAPAFSPATISVGQTEFPGFAQAVAALQHPRKDTRLDLQPTLLQNTEPHHHAVHVPPATTPALPTDYFEQGQLSTAHLGLLMENLVIHATSARASFHQGDSVRSKLSLDCLKHTVHQVQLSCVALGNAGHNRSHSLLGPASPSAVAPSSVASSAMPTPAAEQPPSVFPFDSPGLGKRRSSDVIDELGLGSSKHFRASNAHQDDSTSQPDSRDLTQGILQPLTIGSRHSRDPGMRSVETAVPDVLQSPLDACKSGPSSVGNVPHQLMEESVLQDERLLQSLLTNNPPPNTTQPGCAAGISDASSQEPVAVLDAQAGRPPTRRPNNSLPTAGMHHFRGEPDRTFTSALPYRAEKASIRSNIISTAHMRAASDSYVMSPLNPHTVVPMPAQHFADNSLDETSSSMGVWTTDLTPETQDWLDQVLLEFLNELCSDLQFKDRTGQEVHQLLMPKRMARLDERPGFRPFRFRINAFTQAFHARVVERHSKRGSEFEWTLKRVKKYLWSQPLISRFNEDGRKAKSRGNHNWIINARKRPDGGWEFREFTRRIAGAPMRACLNVPWVWKLRIWDPLGSSIAANYEVQEAPRWVGWMHETVHDVLVGTPTSTSEGGTITVVATFQSNGQTEELRQSFFLDVVHAEMMDSTTNGTCNTDYESKGRIRFPGDTVARDSATVIQLGSGSQLQSTLPAGHRGQPTLSTFQFPRGTTAGAGLNRDVANVSAVSSSFSSDNQEHLPLVRKAIESRQQDHANKLLLSLPMPRDSAGPTKSSPFTTQAVSAKEIEATAAHDDLEFESKGVHESLVRAAPARELLHDAQDSLLAPANAHNVPNIWGTHTGTEHSYTDA